MHLLSLIRLLGPTCKVVNLVGSWLVLICWGGSVWLVDCLINNPLTLMIWLMTDQGGSVCLCHVCCLVLTCTNQIKPHVTLVYTVWWHGTRWGLPRGTKWGPLVSHLVAWWDPQWWGGPIVNCHVAYRVEVASLCATIWHLFSLLCTTHTLPSGSSADVAYNVAQSNLATCLCLVKWLLTWTNEWVPRGICGAHLSGDLCQGGAHSGEVDQWDCDTW
jgi:hypothetical protein